MPRPIYQALTTPPAGRRMRRRVLWSVLCVLGAAGCNAGYAVGARGAQDEAATTSTSGTVNGTSTLDPNDTVQKPPLEMLPGAAFKAAQDGNAMVVYWGQNPAGQEPDLASVCAQPQYSTIIISFIYAFGGAHSGDPNGYPSLNIGNHCTTPISPNNPNFLSCPDIAAAIPVCQQAGKKILLSMGGAEGSYGFASDAEGQQMAQIIWNTLLGGHDPMRPFGSAVLDGIDLDIEQGTPTGYAAFAKALRALMLADARKTYYLTAAPQCPFPDPFLGPGANTPLGDAIASFDFLYVQFYNNTSCQTSSPQGWPTALGAWTGLYSGGTGPKIFMGLPAAAGAAKEGYLDPSQAAPVIQRLKASPAVGGIMLWDSGYDLSAPGPYSVTMQNLLRAQAP